MMIPLTSSFVSKRKTILRDVISIIIFFVCVLAGTIFINQYIFRSFSVQGPSMEDTLHTGERLIVNRIPVTIKNLANEKWLPKRAEIIVFKNPKYQPIRGDEFIVKRVIAFSGERVVVKNGKLTVYTGDNLSQKIDVQELTKDTIGDPTSGDCNVIVPPDEIFVSGDHREKNYSLDSRNGLGTIPIHDIIGPVALRLWPIDKVRIF